MFELTRILEVDISYFFEGYETPGSYLRMEDSAAIPKFLDFVSSNEGISLIRVFTRIKTRRTRRAMIDMAKSLAG